MSAPAVVLYASPPLVPLPASDAESLYILSLLRLSRLDFAVRTGDYGLNYGKLPYLTHLDTRIRARHLSSLPGFEDPDAPLSAEERAETTAWVAYIDAKLVDLVNHSLYVLPENYALLANAQKTGLAFPQSTYIPQRIRSIVSARLDYVGLAGLGQAEDAPVETVTGPAGTSAPVAFSWKAGRLAADRARKWGQEEVLKKAREVLDPLARRLGRGRFFFRDRATTLDIALFAQLTLLLSPALPTPLLSNLIKETYPSLGSHHDRTLSLLFPAGWSFSPRPAAVVPAQSWAGLVAIGREVVDAVDPRNLWRAAVGAPQSGEAGQEGQGRESGQGREGRETRESGRAGQGEGKGKGKKKMSEKEKAFVRARWAWFAGAGVAMVTYLFASGIVSIDFGGDEEEDEEEEDEDVDEMVVVEEVEVGNGAGSGRGKSGLPVWEDDEDPDAE